MTACVSHRGPDDIGQIVEDGIALGHRRLAIIDLTAGGHQPMTSRSGRCVVVYNGEMFNYVELREELRRAGRRFTSRSDTEVLLQAYEEWGEDCVKRFNGQFAFVLWDRERRTLFAARDRFGVKPLYYYQSGDLFAAASEIKALLAHPEIRVRVSYPALAEYFSFQLDHALTLKDLEWLAGHTRLPVLVKGVVRPDDARRSLSAGARGVIVSNHGGRQLDYSIATLDALPAVVDEVGGEVPVLLDGGVRRGTDVLKALALGARSVMIGRPYLWALAVGGSDGVGRLLELLRDEIAVSMSLLGVRRLDELSSDLLARP